MDRIDPQEFYANADNNAYKIAKAINALTNAIDRQSDLLTAAILAGKDQTTQDLAESARQVSYLRLNFSHIPYKEK